MVTQNCNAKPRVYFVCNAFRRGSKVYLQTLENASTTKEVCQICGTKLKILEIEPHPRRVEWEIHGFCCENCGPVKSLVVKRL